MVVPAVDWGEDGPTKQWVGVYGGTVNSITNKNTYESNNTSGLASTDNASYIQIEKTDYKPVSKHKMWKSSNGATFDELKSNYYAGIFASMAGENLSNGDVTITVSMEDNK